MIETLLLQALTGFKAQSILDVGPGFGNFSRLAAKITGATRITYLDCDDEVLAWQIAQCCQEGFVAEGHRAILVPAEIHQMTGHYDLILCQEVLEHLIDAENVLHALAGRLTENGRVLITVPTKLSERWLKFINDDYMKNEEFGHVREFDRKSLSAGLVS